MGRRGVVGAASKHVILTLNLCYRETKYHSRGVRDTETGRQGDGKKGKLHQWRARRGGVRVERAEREKNSLLRLV